MLAICLHENETYLRFLCRTLQQFELRGRDAASFIKPSK